MSKYSKPNILFQPMNLFANISASCANGYDHADEKSCAVSAAGTTVFTSQCKEKDFSILEFEGLMPKTAPPTGGELEGDFGENDSTCYHVPFAFSTTAFMS